MATEKEINDAIAIVREASRDGRVEYEFADTGRWSESNFHSCKYRAKPDPIELWVVIDKFDCTTTYRSKYAAEKCLADFGGRLVHLREVEE